MTVIFWAHKSIESIKGESVKCFNTGKYARCDGEMAVVVEAAGMNATDMLLARHHRVD